MADHDPREGKTYCLARPWALRGWQDRPLCLVNTERPFPPPRRLSFAQFSLLDRCDGAHILPDSEMLREFLREGIVSEGTRPPDETQRCRLFPYVRRTAVRLSVTGRCNYRCRHCYAADADGNRGGEISPALFRSLVRQMEDMGMDAMDITGGEPLLHPRLTELLQCLAESRITLKTLYTNGALLTEEFLDGLTAMGHHPVVQVSFDGFGAHDWMRGAAGAEQSALRALRLLKAGGFRIRIGMNANGRTAPVLIDSCRRLVREFRPDFYILYTGPTPRWLSSGGAENALGLGTYYDLCTELSRACVAEQWGVGMQMFQFPDVPDRAAFDAFREMLHRSVPVRESVPLMHCYLGCNTLHIACDGRVLPCSGFEGASREDGFLCGEDIDLHHRSLAEILTESSCLRICRATVGDLIKKEPECAECEWLMQCRGGCRLLALDRYRKHPEYDRRSEAQCLFFRGGYALKYEQVMAGAFRALEDTRI